MTFDLLFKNFMKDILDDCQINVDEPVGKLPLKIDLVLKCSKKPSFKKPLTILENRMSSINILEYKSNHDVPKRQDIPKMMGYVGLYASQNSKDIINIMSDFTAWYITVKKPKFV
ncbi:MAG: hypothetical protein ACTSVI_12265, partial [Promethearchaeota archaeon]